MTDWQIPAALRNFGSVSQGVYVRKGSEVPQRLRLQASKNTHEDMGRIVPMADPEQARAPLDSYRLGDVPGAPRHDEVVCSPATRVAIGPIDGNGHRLT
jgi:hypothetical protein